MDADKCNHVNVKRSTILCTVFPGEDEPLVHCIYKDCFEEWVE